MSRDLNKPIRILEQHNKVIQKATSSSAKERVSRNVFNALRESFGQTADARARSRPGMFHHVYEWGQVGSASGRLFTIRSTNRGKQSFGITYDFQKSSVPVPGSEPHIFFEKARVMEDQQPVIIEPINGSVLSFEYDGKRVFTPGPIAVDNPGGAGTKNAFRNAFMTFFRPSVINNNPAYRAVIEAEKRKILNEISRAK
jgi:hypothetical protein